jgi:NAD-dependent DNA ligase
MLTLEDIERLLSSERLAEKLFFEIENSKNASLNTLLPGFGIPLIGTSASRKLAKVCELIYDISEVTCRSAGLGPKATENLLSWKTREFPALEDLPFSFRFDHEKEPEKTLGIVCITGRLKTYRTKAEATKILKDLGYEVKNSLTKDVTILVNESGIESSKTQSARESGILIVNDLSEIIGE